MFVLKLVFTRSSAAIIAVIGALMLSGCGIALKDVLFTPGYQPAPMATITVGEVADAAPKIKRGNEHKNFDIAKKCATNWKPNCGHPVSSPDRPAANSRW